MKKQSFKHNLVGFIALMVVLMFFVNIYSMLVIESAQNQYSSMIEKMLTINEVGNDVNRSAFYFDKYFTTKSVDDENNYEETYRQAINKLNHFNSGMNEEILVNLTDLKNVIENYHTNGENAISILLATESKEDCYKYFVETKQIASYSGEYVTRLNNSYLKYYDSNYKNLKKRTFKSTIMITIFLSIITLFSVIFSLVFSKMITEPIGELVHSAEEIAKGNFEVQKMNPTGMYEIDALEAGFNKMVFEIRQLIEKIKENAIIEKKLNDQEMKNLLVENMLRETQLKALQSQINPHFLFNTLNTIAQTSIIEDAYETENLINAVSELLRYSLNMIDRQSKIASEIEIIKQYVYIQETRFKDRVKFNINVDRSLNNVQVPGMILQPLVENAFIHGIEGREEGGIIDVSVYREDDYCIIKVEDNGNGMDEKKLKEILEKEENQGRGHTTGIGVKNVIKRLRIMYSNEDVFRIESLKNKGTRIYIKIPVDRGERYV